MRQAWLAIAACAALLAAGSPQAASAAGAAREQTTTRGCPRYEVLMRAASTALERGERKVALGHLREARGALDACSRGRSRANAVAIASGRASDIAGRVKTSA